MTLADLLSFVKNMPQKEETPPYLDPTHDGYNSELAIVIETWKALFIDEEFIKEKTAKKAAIKYIKSKYPNHEGNVDSGTGELGRAVVMLNKGLVANNAWSEFTKKHKK